MMTTAPPVLAPGDDPPDHVLLLTPIVPAATGNGAAMRAGLLLRGLARTFEVTVVVVPVIAGPSDLGWARAAAHALHVAPLAESAAAPGTAPRPLLDWQQRVARAEPLPELAARASGTLADTIAAQLGDPRRMPVIAFRAYLAPLALALAERLGAPWCALDADDDDEAFFRSRGLEPEAAAYRRLLAELAPAFDWVSLASPTDAARLGALHTGRFEVVANGVELPTATPGPGNASPAARLLFVGNLGYEPNVEAALELGLDVLPLVQAAVAGPVELVLAGGYGPGSAIAALAGLDGVRALGYVEDLATVYASADVAVCPLRQASGTRIKLLEAFAHRLPTVASPTAAQGVDVRDGEHLLLADDPRETAAAVLRLLADPELAAGLVSRARALVEDRYSAEAVTARIAALAAIARSASSSTSISPGSTDQA